MSRRLIGAMLLACFAAELSPAQGMKLGNRSQAVIAGGSGLSMAMGYFFHVPEAYMAGILMGSFVATYRLVKSAPKKKGLSPNRDKDKEVDEGSLVHKLPDSRKRRPNLHLPSSPTFERLKWQVRKTFHLMPSGHKYGAHK